MNHQTVFRVVVIRERALRVRNKMVERLQQQLQDNDLNEAAKMHIRNNIADIFEFKASDNWVALFMRRHNLCSKRGMGPEVFLSADDICVARKNLQRQICKIPIENVSNSDEVAVLYRCLPIRALQDSEVGTSFIRVKDRLTVVLTIYADRSKAPLTIIGTSRNPRSFPRHFNGPKDMGLFWLCLKRCIATHLGWYTF